MADANKVDLILRRPPSWAAVSKDGRESVPCIHPSRRALKRAPQDEAELFHPLFRGKDTSESCRKQVSRRPAEHLMNMHTAMRQWPAEGLTRVPYWVYSDRALYDEERSASSAAIPGRS